MKDYLTFLNECSYFYQTSRNLEKCLEYILQFKSYVSLGYDCIFPISLLIQKIRIIFYPITNCNFLGNFIEWDRKVAIIVSHIILRNSFCDAKKLYNSLELLCNDLINDNQRLLTSTLNSFFTFFGDIDIIDGQVVFGNLFFAIDLVGSWSNLHYAISSNQIKNQEKFCDIAKLMMNSSTLTSYTSDGLSILHFSAKYFNVEAINFFVNSKNGLSKLRDKVYGLTPVQWFLYMLGKKIWKHYENQDVICVIIQSLTIEDPKLIWDVTYTKESCKGESIYMCPLYLLFNIREIDTKFINHVLRIAIKELSSFNSSVVFQCILTCIRHGNSDAIEKIISSFSKYFNTFSRLELLNCFQSFLLETIVANKLNCLKVILNISRRLLTQDLLTPCLNFPFLHVSITVDYFNLMKNQSTDDEYFTEYLIDFYQMEYHLHPEELMIQIFNGEIQDAFLKISQRTSPLGLIFFYDSTDLLMMILRFIGNVKEKLLKYFIASSKLPDVALMSLMCLTCQSQCISLLKTFIDIKLIYQLLSQDFEKFLWIIRSSSTNDCILDFTMLPIDQVIAYMNNTFYDSHKSDLCIANDIKFILNEEMRQEDLDVSMISLLQILQRFVNASVASGWLSYQHYLCKLFRVGDFRMSISKRSWLTHHSKVSQISSIRCLNDNSCCLLNAVIDNILKKSKSIFLDYPSLLAHLIIKGYWDSAITYIRLINVYIEINKPKIAWIEDYLFHPIVISSTILKGSFERTLFHFVFDNKTSQESTLVTKVVNINIMYLIVFLHGKELFQEFVQYFPFPMNKEFVMFCIELNACDYLQFLEESKVFNDRSNSNRLLLNESNPFNIHPRSSYPRLLNLKRIPLLRLWRLISRANTPEVIFYQILNNLKGNTNLHELDLNVFRDLIKQSAQDFSNLMFELLFWSSIRGQVSIMKHLFDYTSINLNSNLETILWHLILESDRCNVKAYEAAAMLLLDNGCSIDRPSPSATSCIDLAIIKGMNQLVEKLCQVELLNYNNPLSLSTNNYSVTLALASLHKDISLSNIMKIYYIHMKKKVDSNLFLSIGDRFPSLDNDFELHHKIILERYESSTKKDVILKLQTLDMLQSSMLSMVSIIRPKSHQSHRRKRSSESILKILNPIQCEFTRVVNTRCYHNENQYLFLLLAILNKREDVALYLLSLYQIKSKTMTLTSNEFRLCSEWAYRYDLCNLFQSLHHFGSTNLMIDICSLPILKDIKESLSVTYKLSSKNYSLLEVGLMFHSSNCLNYVLSESIDIDFTYQQVVDEVIKGRLSNDISVRFLERIFLKFDSIDLMRLINLYQVSQENLCIIATRRNMPKLVFYLHSKGASYYYVPDATKRSLSSLKIAAVCGFHHILRGMLLSNRIIKRITEPLQKLAYYVRLYLLKK